MITLEIGFPLFGLASRTANAEESHLPSFQARVESWPVGVSYFIRVWYVLNVLLEFPQGSVCSICVGQEWVPKMELW